MLAGIRYRWLQVEQVGSATVVQITCQHLVDERMIRAIGEQLFALVKLMGERPTLVLNCRGVKHLSSSVIGMLLGVHRRVQAAGGHLALCGFDRQLKVIFTLTRMDKILSIYPDEQEALLSL